MKALLSPLNCFLFVFALVPFIQVSFFFRPFVEPKWIAVLFLALGLIIFSLVKKIDLKLPRLQPWFWISAVLILIHQLALNTVRGVPIITDSMPDRIAFLVLLIAGYNIQFNDRRFLQKLGRAYLASVGVFCVWFISRLMVQPPAQMEMVHWLGLSLGHINMAAQFIAFSIPFLLSEVQTAENEKSKWIFGLLAAMMSVCLIQTGCRSVLIGVFLLLIYRFSDLKKISFRKLLPFLLLAVILISLTNLPLLGMFLKKIKIGMPTFNERLLIWKTTLRMFLEHPFGVGVDQFEQAIIHYFGPGYSPLEEDVFFQSPHNDFLRVLSEEGVVGFLLFFFSVGIVLKKCLEACRNQPVIRSFLVSMILLWLPELLFQFPLMMANLILVLSLSVGAVLSHEKQDSISISMPVQLACLLLLANLGISRGWSDYQAGRYPQDPARVQMACDLYSSRWRTCLSAAALSATEGKSVRPKEIVDSMLAVYPDFYPALRTAAKVSAFLNEREKSCQYLKKYDAMFKKRVSDNFCKSAASF